MKIIWSRGSFPKVFLKVLLKLEVDSISTKEGVTEVKVKGISQFMVLVKYYSSAKLTIKSGKIVKAECSFNISLDDYELKFQAL